MKYLVHESTRLVAFFFFFRAYSRINLRVNFAALPLIIAEGPTIVSAPARYS